MTTSGITSDNEWYNEWQWVVQRVTTNDSEWQRMTTSGTTNDNEWQRVTTNENEWQRVAISAKYSFFQITENPTTKHPKQNSLKTE